MKTQRCGVLVLLAALLALLAALSSCAGNPLQAKADALRKDAVWPKFMRYVDADPTQHVEVPPGSGVTPKDDWVRLGEAWERDIVANGGRGR